MLQLQNNEFSCPSCGRTWDITEGDDLKAGGPCPSDDCPSHKAALVETVSAVCADFDGNGIFSIGAKAVFDAVTPHWSRHLDEGQHPQIIMEDLKEISRLLDLMGRQILYRMSVTVNLPELTNPCLDVTMLRPSGMPISKNEGSKPLSLTAVLGQVSDIVSSTSGNTVTPPAKKL